MEDKQAVLHSATMTTSEFGTATHSFEREGDQAPLSIDRGAVVVGLMLLAMAFTLGAAAGFVVAHIL